jgi:cell division septation protein DedD
MQVAPVFPPPARQPNAVAEVPVHSRADAGPPRDNGRTAAPPANTRLAARVAGPGGTAPLSLSPDTSVALPAAAPRDVDPPRAPTRVAAAPAGGGFLVQVSSQRSEADAENSYRSIQAKYSSVLNGHRHLIRRAELGGKGTYYRAMVGPFGSREQAIQLCVSLKAAGGDCVVQAN